MNRIKPCPQEKASTTIALDNPKVSARGASIGIDNTANPDVDGIKIPKNTNINSKTTANNPLPISETRFEE